MIQIHAEQQEQKAKERLINNYDIALLTSVFTNRANNGKQPPTLSEVYPDYFPNENPEEEEVIDNSWIYLKEQMLDYAEMRNQQTKEVKENDA